MIKIEPLFAVPLGLTTLAQTENLNARLTSFFLEAEQNPERFANKYRNSIDQKEVFESRFDLFSWNAPVISELKELLLSNLFKFVVELNRIQPEQAKRLELRADSWFHVTRKGGYFTAHNHPNASWSLVYCVDGGDNVSQYPENAVLRFIDFKANAQMYLDPGNTNLPAPFSLGNKVFKLKAGDLVIFPSYLLHEVSPYFGETPRITVAVNAWFRDPKIAYPGIG